MALIPIVGNQHPVSMRNGKKQVSFKIFYAKWIYFSFELQTINTKPKLIRISNIPLWSIGSSWELFIEKDIQNCNNFKMNLLASDYELFL